MTTENCKDCVHFYICYYKNCGKCGKHLHEAGVQLVRYDNPAERK